MAGVALEAAPGDGLAGDRLAAAPLEDARGCALAAGDDVAVGAGAAPAGAADPEAAAAFFIRSSSARSLYSSTRLSICVRLIRVKGSALAMWLKAPSCA